MFKSVLTVCIGNICRSPMAEGVLRAQCREAGHDIRVESAGIQALSGRPADPLAVELLAARGIDITGHVARQLTYEILRDFDLVLVMEAQHQQRIEQLAPLARGRVFTLGRWGGFDVADPYKRPREAFEEALRLIDQGVASWVRYLR